MKALERCVLFGIMLVLSFGLNLSAETRESEAAFTLLKGPNPDSRAIAVHELLRQMNLDAPFSFEEKLILRQVEAGKSISILEADVLISRALYDSFVGNLLSSEQEKLLDRYIQKTRNSNKDLADKKMAAVKKRWESAMNVVSAVQVAPDNDLCAGAEVISPTGPFPYLTSTTPDITDATTTGDPALIPSCTFEGGPVSRSIWYSFTPSTSGNFTISTCADAPTQTTVDDTVLGIYTSLDGTCGTTMTEIPTGSGSDGCDDDGCSTEDLQSTIDTNLVAGVTYYIVVWQFDTPPPTSGNTSVQLQIVQGDQPGNDNCQGSVPALQLNIPASGILNDLTANDFQLSGSACFTGIGQTATTATGRDVVYSFTPATNGNYSLKMNSTGFANPVLYVANNCPSAAPPNIISGCVGASNRNIATTPGSEEVECIALTGGTPYSVFLDETGLGTTPGSYSLEVTPCIRETGANNTPASANPIACGIEGAISPNGDVDFFALGTQSAGSRVFAMAESLGSNDPDLQMRVTSTTGTLEFDDDDNDVPFSALSPNCSGTPVLVAGQTYLRINHFDSGTQSEPYRLYSVVQQSVANATPETEPNDTIETANTGANNYFSGTMGTTTDVDFFGTPAAAGDLLVVQLDTDANRDNTPFNGSLALLDATGAVLVSVDDGRATSNTIPGAGSLTSLTPNSPGEALVWRVRSTGAYFVRVSWVSTGATPNDYLLSISRNCTPGSGGAVTADVQALNVDTPDPVVPNHNITYNITVNNNGPGNTFDATLNDAIPANTTFQGASPGAGWSCSTPSVGGTGNVSCVKAALPAGSEIALQFQVFVAPGTPDGTIIANTAIIQSALSDPDPSNNSDTATTTVQCPAITILPATLPDGTLGILYNQNLIASGGTGPYAFIVSSGALPSGLTLASDGTLSGTPTSHGTSNFAVTATDADGCSMTQNYSLLINCPSMAIDQTSLPDPELGISYMQALTVTGGTGPYNFAISSGSLPGGLLLSSTGIVSGIPMQSGVFHFQVSATDANGCVATQSYTLSICSTITLSPAVLPNGATATNYSQLISANGGAGPYAFTVSAGALPAGLSLDSNGNLNGTPTAAGSFNFDVTATDTTGCTGVASYALTIDCAVIFITPAALPHGNNGTVYSQNLIGNGGIAPYSFTLDSGTLPTGLTLSAAGSITGIPTVEATFNFDVRATDSSGCFIVQIYAITINPACLFCDDFEDGVLNTMWNYSKPTWTESGGSLVATGSGKKLVAAANPVFAGCANCSVESTVSVTAGGGKTWLLGWYVDKKNDIELLFRESTNKWILKERINGKIKKKAKAISAINPNTFYDVVMNFDGATFTVTLDGALLITMTPKTTTHNGSVGYQVKGHVTASFGLINVN